MSVRKIKLEKKTKENANYRTVLDMGGKHLQLVLMTLIPHETIPYEIHRGIDQFVRVERGAVTLRIYPSKTFTLKDGDAVIIPAGVKHEFSNNTSNECHLYTLYSKVHHRKNLIQHRQPLSD
jgi:quercetin dioxygenase-like cupin family protein